MSPNRYSRWAIAALSFALLAGCGRAPTPLAAPPVPTPDAPAPAGPASAAPAAPAAPTPAASTVPAATAAPAQAPASTPGTPTPAPPTAAPAAAAPAAGWQSGLTGIPLALGTGDEAYLALATEAAQPGELKLSLAPEAGAATAYRTLSAEAAPPAGPADATARLRRIEARLDGLKPRATYRVQNAAARELGATESAWVIATSDAETVTDERVTARVAYVGEHCDVLVDVADGTSLDERARALGTAFDERIHPTDTRLFGALRPVGPRGERVTIVITPVVGNHGQDTTLGYFTARDLFAPADAPNEPFLQHSNQGAYLYMADRIVARGQAVESLGTLAHEFQHLISATHKLQGAAGRQEALWLNEALSMYAMAANGYGMPDGSRVIATHVAEYLRSPQRYSLTRWELNPQQSGYGAAYLFATYLVERAGEGILSELVAAPETGLANLDARLGTRGLSVRQLFRDWVAATMLDGTGAGGVHEYGALDLRGTYGGVTLTGVAMPTVALPNAGRVPSLPYSASFLRLRGASGGPFTLDVAGGASQQVGAFLAPR